MKRFLPYFLIIALGLLYGYFISQFYIYPVPPAHSLSWGGARWITAASKGPVGVFRKELFIPGRVADAWVQVSAPDTYKLSVNGKSIVENTFYSSNVSGIHDIAAYLVPGRNVIAVSNRRLSFPGESKLLARGIYKDVSGSETEFLSDSTWKALDREDCRGGTGWESPFFDASSWGRALEAGRPASGETYPVAFPPGAVTSPLSAKWIRHPDPFSRQAIFRKDFVLSERPREGWLRMATATDYEIIVNGTPAGSGNAAQQMDVYAVGGLLKKGTNSIEVVIKNPLKTAHALYLDGMAKGDKFALPLRSDSGWKASLTEGARRSERPFEIGNYQAYLYAKRPKTRVELDLPFDYTAKKFLAAAGVTGAAILLVYLSVFFFSRGASLLSKISPKEGFSFFSFALVLPLLFLLALFVLQFDIRVAPGEVFSSRVIYGAPLLLLFAQALTLIWFLIRKREEIAVPRPDPPNYSNIRRAAVGIAVFLLIAVGAFIRLNDLGFISLNGDEIGTIRFAEGILKKGYPFITLGGIEKPATTYELLPYPVAAAIGLFGISETVVRLPSALFGTVNILVVFLLGRKLANTGAGLLAAALYTFMPLEVNLAQNARYMVAEQFYALLCCYFYYRAMEKEEINTRAVYAASLFFVLGYLTWEGSGYILPALLAATFALKGRDFRWMKSWHLWAASLGASVIVLIQLAYRTYWSVPFMIIGSGLSDATFKFMFLTQAYNPWYYVKNFLLTQNHIFLSALALIGLPFILKSRGLRYIFVILGSVLFLFSNTFSLYATRYIYFLQPLLIILASAALLKIAELASGLVEGFRSPGIKFLRYGIPVALSSLLFMATNDYILKPYRLSPNPAPVEDPRGMDLGGVIEERRNLYPVDFRGVNTYLKDHLLPGDVVVTVYTHPTLFYAGKADYFEETIVDTQVVYLDDNERERLANKTVDVPTITDLSAFKLFLGNHERVWFVASSFDLFNYLNEKNFIDYFMGTMKPVYETYRARLYLWENGKRI